MENIKGVVRLEMPCKFYIIISLLSWSMSKLIHVKHCMNVMAITVHVLYS